MDQQPVSTQTQVPAKHGRRQGWIWGLIFIVGGVILIAPQMGLLGPRYNWWALFIFIPALASLGGGCAELQRSGKFGSAVRAGLGGGLVILTVGLILLLGMDWTIWWPLLVLVVGFTIFLEGFGTEAPAGVTGIFNFGLWIGLGAMVLGAGFLAKNLGIYDPAAAVTPYRWWAIPILIPGVGAVLGSLAGFLRGKPSFGRSFGLFIFGLMTLATGVIAFLGINWNILGPTLLILLGASILFGIFRKR